MNLLKWSVLRAALMGLALLLGSTMVAARAYPEGFKGYVPIQYFAPISQLTSSCVVSVMCDNLPAKNVKELIEYSRSGPKKFNLGSAGVDSTTQLCVEMMHAAAWLEYVHAHHKGSGPPVNDLLTCELDITPVGYSPVSGFLKGGKVCVLAMTCMNRWPLNPELPVISESIPGYEASPWYGLHASAGSSKTITIPLSVKIIRVLVMPGVVEDFRQPSIQPMAGTPEHIEVRNVQHLTRWGLSNVSPA